MRRANLLAATIAAILLGAWGVTVEAEEEGLPNFDRMWDYGKPAETEQRFRKVLPHAEAAGDLDYLLQLKTQIARTYGLRKRFEEAHALLDTVEPELNAETRVARIRYLLERGRAFNSSGKKMKAKTLFLEAYEFGRKEKLDFYTIDAAHMMGIVEEPAQQVGWTEKALAIAEATEDKRAQGWLGALYNNLGWTYFDLKDYDKALEIHRSGWAWRKKIDPKAKPTRIAKWAVARQLRALGRYDEALKLQTELLEEWKAAGEEGGFVYEEMGELLLVKGKETEATSYFAKAWPLLEKMDWLKEEDPERYARLRKLAGGE